ncbi:hypothetical protein [Microlunatus parietis]|uniref:TM2 domain-containing membrane protein YozV n=1 Tax=Microlunatus parietis TaxID=682979 RepID=A0A7Y9I280_9ACTN|nr:hypothetical protein [Microlunatus parietis]NYE68876.1 TM2 domain-containing membrane protein YozV [Microlunatus parietis]
MPDSLAVFLILWAVAAVLGLCVGGMARLMLNRNDHRDIRTAYLIILAGLGAPVAIPFWIGYGFRAAVLEYRRNAATVRELDR